MLEPTCWPVRDLGLQQGGSLYTREMGKRYKAGLSPNAPEVAVTLPVLTVTREHVTGPQPRCSPRAGILSAALTRTGGCGGQVLPGARVAAVAQV